MTTYGCSAFTDYSPRGPPRRHSAARHRQRCKPGHVRARLERPDRVDQRGDVVTRIPAGGGGAQLVREILVAHWVLIAAARGGLREIIGLPGGGDVDRRRHGA